MTDEPILRFSQALDSMLGLTDQSCDEKGPTITAGIEMGHIIMELPLEEELTIPADLRQAWIERTRYGKEKRLTFPSLSMPRLGFVILAIILTLIIGFYQPVLAAVSQMLGYIYISDVGFLPRSTTRILAQPVRQTHSEQSLTVMRGISTPTETILFLKFTPIAPALDRAWLTLPSGEQLAMKDWRYFPDQPNTSGIQVIFPPIPNSQDQATLALPEGWRLPLRWIPAAQSALPDVQVIPPYEPSLPPSTESEDLCVKKDPIQLCLLAAASSDEKTSLLLQMKYLNPALQPSNLGMTWQTENQPVQLITSQGVSVSLTREEGNTLLFPTLPADQKVTLSIPAVLADIDIPDQYITVDLGDNPQPNDSIPINAQVQVMGATLHFSKATLIGDGVNSLRLNLDADEPLQPYHQITPILLELGKPENIPDLYGSGILSGKKDIFVELIHPEGKIHGKITIPIIKASVIITGPYEISFTIPNGTAKNSLTNGIPTPTVLEVSPANFTPLATPTLRALTGYHSTGEPMQKGDLLFSLSEGDQSKIFLVHPDQSPRLLANLPGVVTQGFVHPDRLGMDYLAGVSKTKDDIDYVDEIQLFSVRFDQSLPHFLYRFPSNIDNLIGTSITANWSFDGRYGIFRLPNHAPAAPGWKYIWMDLNCRISSSCQPQELVLPPSLDLYNAVFAPSDYRILFSGADRAGTGKDDIFLADFTPDGSPLIVKNLTASNTIDVSITPAQWTSATTVFTLCSPSQKNADVNAICQLDIEAGQLNPIQSLNLHQEGMRLYGNYWISPSGKYLAALFFPINAVEGETLPTFRLLNLSSGEAMDLGNAQSILTGAFSPDEKAFAYVAQAEHGWELIKVDLLSGMSQTIVRRDTAIPALWLSWIK